MARANISAHETVEGQAFSKAVFMSSIASKLSRFKLGGACFSDLFWPFGSISTEASHPLTKQS